ncbi:hypothetical protein HanXRQr2_Chr07g0291311 [Helianthus annuus]|uniref:Uncharacterized protein n=1 Tax=Helianthus annuus TaxID=4232 RepID=A0A9K3IK33_HELAN|nr:hypothetical protein HanXRQr2_Chr07g0291311 [Helianthus annuus]
MVFRFASHFPLFFISYLKKLQPSNFSSAPTFNRDMLFSNLITITFIFHVIIPFPLHHHLCMLLPSQMSVKLHRTCTKNVAQTTMKIDERKSSFVYLSRQNMNETVNYVLMKYKMKDFSNRCLLEDTWTLYYCMSRHIILQRGQPTSSSFLAPFASKLCSLLYIDIEMENF